jgi:hypothetical protein
LRPVCADRRPGLGVEPNVEPGNDLLMSARERAVAAGGSVRASACAKPVLPEASMPSIMLDMMLGMMLS